MMKPAVPKPTAEYMAAKRAECKKASPCDDKAKKEMREQAPFWMSQASIAYSVPDKYGQPGVEDIPLPGKYGPLTYNTVEFDESRQIVNSGNASRGYLSMGSFFSSIDNEPNSNINIDNVTGRYFLVAAGEEGWSIGDTEFAPPHSFILAFAGTEPPTQTSSSSGIPFCEGFQDGIPLIKAPVDFPIKTSKGTVCYQTYKGMFNVSGRASHCIPSLPVLRRAARPTPAGAPADV